MAETISRIHGLDGRAHTERVRVLELVAQGLSLAFR